MKDKGKTYGHLVKGVNWDLDDEAPRQAQKMHTPISRTKAAKPGSGSTPGTIPVAFKLYNE